MGTTTFFLRLNDLGKPLNKMDKKELGKLNNLSPYGETSHYVGWRVLLELHNGNVYVLVFWKGRLMKIEEAPKILSKKYYNKYRGKEVNEYEWTLFKRSLLAEIEEMDKEFKRSVRKKPAVKRARRGR